MAEVSSVGIVVPGSVRENACRGGIWYFGYSILPIGVILDTRAEMEMSPASGAAETDARLIRTLVRTEKNWTTTPNTSLSDNILDAHQTPALTTDTQSYCM